jgi:hypothetical protein
MCSLNATREGKLTMERKLKVGDILESSWGYDQTNIDFYQVIALVGKASVKLQKMACNSTPEIGFMTAEKTPTRPVGDPFTKREGQFPDTGRPYIRISNYAYAFPWDGKPARYSWYA